MTSVRARHGVWFFDITTGQFRRSTERGQTTQACDICKRISSACRPSEPNCRCPRVVSLKNNRSVARHCHHNAVGAPHRPLREESRFARAPKKTASYHDCPIATSAPGDEIRVRIFLTENRKHTRGSRL